MTSYSAEAVFDGERIRRGVVLRVKNGTIVELGSGAADADLGPGIIAPGFVDLQVNGGGGVMLGDAPTENTLRRMADAHAALGATTILPTLISDTIEVTRRTLEVAQHTCGHVPGILGLHLEGPHLAPAKAGAHRRDRLRPMDASDLDVLVAAAGELPVLMVTLAPEMVQPQQIAALTKAGVIVALGHSEASFEEAQAAIAAGARVATHLFNAMNPLASRSPGLVGAALVSGEVSAGLIADGVHVDPAAMAVALAAKQGPGRIFLVSDAMAPAGTDLSGFGLQGRWIARKAGRLTTEDGTLAGADLDLPRAVQTVRKLGVAEGAALAMASSVPADVAGIGDRAGRLDAGRAADFVHLGPDGRLSGVWRGGRRIV
ncbi:MAG: N-acetylglucosamine-6-phosphate deacetylase [Pseudomonadota bacterium]